MAVYEHTGAVVREPEDKRAFAPEQFQDDLRLLARMWLPRRLRRKLDASDLVQEAQLKACAKGDQFEGDTVAQYKVWLRQILKNTLLDEIDRRRLPEQSARAVDDASHRTEIWLMDSAPSVGSKFVNEELFAVLARALAKLPDHWQEAIVLRYLHGLKVIEIMEELQQPRAVVAGWLRRALARLREDPQLRAYFDEV